MKSAYTMKVNISFSKNLKDELYLFLPDKIFKRKTNKQKYQELDKIFTAILFKFLKK